MTHNKKTYHKNSDSLCKHVALYGLIGLLYGVKKYKYNNKNKLYVVFIYAKYYFSNFLHSVSCLSQTIWRLLCHIYFFCYKFCKNYDLFVFFFSVSFTLDFVEGIM